MDTDSLYRGKILDHYQDPHNSGEVPDADMAGEADNPSCGDDLTFTAAVDDGTFTDLKFAGNGCALSIAAASVLTDELQEAAVDAVHDVSDDDLFGMLGLEKDDVSPMRVKCVLLARDGIISMVTDDDDA